MQEVTKQLVLEASQEEKSISWDDFTETEIFFYIGPEVNDQKTFNFTKVICAKLRLSQYVAWRVV